MSDLTQVQDCAMQYAREREQLADVVQTLQGEIEALQRRRLPAIRRRVGRAAEAKDRLRAAIEAVKDGFRRPRTQVFSGIRCGYAKQKGQVVIDDEPATIARMRKLLPADQSELLIRVKESVHKPGVYDLTAADLKRLGIRITDAGDAIVIKPTDGAVDKIVAALLKDAEHLADRAGEPS